MSRKVLLNEESLRNIAEAIRSKNGEATTYRPGDMAAAIQAIPKTDKNVPYTNIDNAAGGRTITIPKQIVT